MQAICPILSVVVKTFLCYLPLMRCPYCRTVVEEQAAECPSCQLSYQRTTALLGSLPRIMPNMQDASVILSPRELRKLKAHVRKLEDRFPQVRWHLVVQNLPLDRPIDLYAFWIFNSGMLAMEADKGAENRDIMVLLDPSSHRVAMMVGYGLEPFLQQQALDHLLSSIEPMWSAGQWLAGFLALLDGLDALLESAATQAAEALGIQTVFDPDRSQGAY